jgi:hypothetical protein
MPSRRQHIFLQHITCHNIVILQLTHANLFEKAMLWELIPLERNPIGLVELKGVSKRLRPPRILTEEEFGALRNQLVHPYRCMVFLAGCTDFV